jgi:hypothetical protein
MTGESNYMRYTVEPQAFDAGLLVYNKTTDREMTIHNQVGHSGAGPLGGPLGWGDLCSQINCFVSITYPDQAG